MWCALCATSRRELCVWCCICTKLGSFVSEGGTDWPWRNIRVVACWEFVFFHVMSPSPLLSLLYLRRPLWWKKAKQRGVLTLVITAGRRQERTSLPHFFLLFLPLLSFLPGLVFESDHIKSLVLDVWQIHNTAQVNVTPRDFGDGVRPLQTATGRSLMLLEPGWDERVRWE